MILDCHIHIQDTSSTADDMLSKMKEAGIDGGIVLSALASNMNPNAKDYKTRVDHVIQVCKGHSLLFPFHFINPTEEDALSEIDYAIEKGIMGFKIICNTFSPSDPRCIQVYRYIAKKNKPILFHTGILWDGKNDSGKYNKPIEYEVLLKIDGLRFAFAHISWPWHDECVAVYGKFNNAKISNKEIACEMFIDNTPGTPVIYRKDALTKVYRTGYLVEDNVMFGLDNSLENYNVQWAKDWIQRDLDIYKEIGLTSEQIEKVFSKNVLRFVGVE